MIPTGLLEYARIFMTFTGVPLLFVMDGVFIYYGRRIYKVIEHSPLGDMLYTLMVSMAVLMNICIWIVLYLMFINLQFIIYGFVPLYIFWMTLFSVYIRVIIRLYKTLMIETVHFAHI